MVPKAPSSVGWEFDRFTLMPEKRLLLSDGTAVALTSKAFDTLVFLVENRDRVVTKDELLAGVWPDVVVEEGNLTQQIFLLRKALGESAQQPRYIATVPGHGYRFAAPTRQISPELATAPKARLHRPDRALAFRLGLLTVAGLLLVLLWTRREVGPWFDPRTARITRVTETGKAVNAVLSPDGLSVAYVENEGDEYSVWVQRIATGGRTEVVPRQPLMVRCLTFSRDGEYLYFTRGSLGRAGFVLHRVPAIGGRETPVLDDVDTPITFSPDGRQFAFMRSAGGGATHIVVADADGGQQQILASRRAPLAFSFAAPAWSPDGAIVAATALDLGPSARSSILLLPVAGGAGRELYASDSRIGGLCWLHDGSGLLTVISETLSRQFAPWQTGLFVHLSGGPIWRIAYPSGAADRLTTDLAEYDLCCIGVDVSGRTISGVVNSLVSDLWIARADGLEAPRQITSGAPVMTRHSWLPDNDTIVYRDLAGRLNAVRKDGRGFSIQVPDGHKVAGGVSACGDGRYVVFEAVPGRSIWRVAPGSGGATQLTSNYVDGSPACSPDGRWIVYSSMRQNASSTWRIPIDGGEPTRLTGDETFDPQPSPSGRLLFYSGYEWEERPLRTRELRWIVMSVADGVRVVAFKRPADATPGIAPGWAPDESGLDYVVTRNGVSNIWRAALSGAPPVQITHFSAGKIFGFNWSRDGKWLSFASGANRSDVVLLSREP